MSYADTVRDHLAAKARHQVDGLGLFDWPQAAPVPTVEQVALDLPEVSIEARYRRWRETPDGVRAWVELEREAAGLVASGADRISAKALVEAVRARLKLTINNSFTAMVGRDLRAIPRYRDLVECRERTSL